MPKMTWSESRSPSGRVRATGPTDSEPSKCRREFTHNPDLLSAFMAVRIHHNDVMVGESCSIRFSASRIVAVDRTKPPYDDPQESRLCRPEL